MPHQQQQDANTHQENTRQKDDTAFFASESAEIPPIQMQAESDRGDQANYLPARFNKLTASRLLGNEISTNAVGQETVRMPLQAKLTIGQPRDKYEQEADRVAKDVVQRLHNPNNGTQPELQRQEEESRRQGETAETILQRYTKVQRNPMTISGEAPRELEGEIDRARSGGQPLAPKLQRSMGEAMGADFSSVKVHTGNEANRLNQSIQAKAFTTGQDVFFKRGAYDPGSKGGQELIAHELTHVVQQNSSTVQRQIQQNISSTSQSPFIQRNADHAARLASLYDLENDYTNMEQVTSGNEKKRFLPYQWKNINLAFQLNDNGLPPIQDRSGNLVSGELLDEKEQDDLDERKRKLSLLDNNSVHLQIMNYLEDKVQEKFGPSGVAQFYKGGHIVFQDNGDIYRAVKALGMPIAATKNHNEIKSKTEFVGTLGTNLGGYVGNPEEQRAGKMFTRDPENSETSHYQPTFPPKKVTRPGVSISLGFGSLSLLDEAEYSIPKTQDKSQDPISGYNSRAVPPQLGIDLPESVKGHILVGIVPPNIDDPSDNSAGHTFIQTEGAGFQNFNEASLAHGKGFTDNKGWTGGYQVPIVGVGIPFTGIKGTQTGLVGKTTYSEKTTTEIREQDNQDVSLVTWDELYEDAMKYALENSEGY